MSICLIGSEDGADKAVTLATMGRVIRIKSGGGLGSGDQSNCHWRCVPLGLPEDPKMFGRDDNEEMMRGSAAKSSAKQAEMRRM